MIKNQETKISIIQLNKKETDEKKKKTELEQKND